jgi:GT2 family glycosyltransferase/glycosyltransferase involved in cell wall biosynthesis
MKHLILDIQTQFIHIIAYNNTSSKKIELPHGFDGRQSLFDDKTLNGKLLRKAQNNLSERDKTIVFIDAQCGLPAYWLTRLITTLAASETAVVCSALSTYIFQLSPLAINTRFEGSPEQLDQLIYHLQPAHTWFETEQINQACFAVNRQAFAGAFARLLEMPSVLPAIACNHLLVQQVNPDTILEASNLPEIGDQNPLAAHPLAALQYQLASQAAAPPMLPGWLQLDDKPVVLHTCTDWGGGMDKWVNDFCDVEDQYHHLILLSQGEFFRQRYGEQFSLRLGGTQGLEIAHFDLSIPIASTTIKHSEYQRLLDDIIRRYGVQGVFVSTLIGHSMDCLRTGLPTIRIFHDYFPDWPALPALLDTDELDLQQALAQSAEGLLGEISPLVFAGWQQALTQAYVQDNVKLVAPDQSVIENLQKISTDKAYQSITVIPHGIPLFPPVEHQQNNLRFTILLPGKMAAGKGEALLVACLPELTEYRVILLGAGDKHDDYSGYPNVEVVADYQADTLPALLQYYQPDVAMILSTASETFSYTLSEMMQAAIPVVATARGALKQRIKHTETGFIVEPKAELVLSLITDRIQHPEKLAEVREHLRTTPQRSVQEAVSQYRDMWNGLLEQRVTYSVTETDERYAVQIAQQALNFKHALSQQQIQLEEQASIITERTNWAQNIQKEKEAGEAVYEQRETEYEQRISHDKAIHEEQVAKREQELSLIYNSHSWKITAPLRMTKKTLSAWRHKLDFNVTKMKTYPRRVINSLTSRGVKGTVAIIYHKLTHLTSQSEGVQEAVLVDIFTPFTITTHDQPRISIIIPVYNQFLHTYNCLASLAALESEQAIEIIVIDDCSTDETSDKIQMIEGIRYHRQLENGGFIVSCNQGAVLAKGEYLLFLNNDTLVQSDWLDSLLNVFSEYPDAGLVGSKLVYPDGTLQEAGGVIFSDASGWNVGRGGNPAAAEYNFVREVDYCSGASIIIRQTLFEQLGRFDTHYKPAYYEDTDLAFAVRAVGEKVYYQPKSVVIHFEGITSGTDIASGIKRYQVVNQEKFLVKWQQALAQQPKPKLGIEQARLHGKTKRVLIYDACVPTPDQDSGSLRMVNLIQILQQLDYHVVFMAENLPFTANYTPALQQMGVECLYQPDITSPIDYFQEKGQHLDAIIVSRYYIAAPVMKMIRQYCPNATLIFDTVDLHYLREQRLAEFEGSNKLAAVAEKTRIKELAVIEQADVTLVVSPFEQDFLKIEAANSRVEIVSNIHTIYGRRKGYAQRQDIMFVGGYQHTPNVDAITWFAEQVFPLIRQEQDIKLHIIGSKAPKEVKALGEIEGIIFHGFVEDIEPFMDDCRIAVAPLRYGAGVKGKVNMSMSYGQPVVATAIAAEGMNLENGHDILTAETEAEFAQAVIRLYNDSQLWQQLSDNGLENVAQWFSFDAAKAALKVVLGNK